MIVCVRDGWLREDQSTDVDVLYILVYFYTSHIIVDYKRRVRRHHDHDAESARYCDYPERAPTAEQSGALKGGRRICVVHVQFFGASCACASPSFFLDIIRSFSL